MKGFYSEMRLDSRPMHEEELEEADAPLVVSSRRSFPSWQPARICLPSGEN